MQSFDEVSMVSENYTVEKKKRSRKDSGKSFISNGLGYPIIKDGNGAIHYQEWCVIDKKGRIMLEGSKKNCELAVELLNRG
jgi:hypothetical protein